MKWISTILGIVTLLALVQCASSKQADTSVHDRVRQLKPDDIASYHEPVKMEIAWVPYTEHRLVMTKKNEWKVVRDEESDKHSAMPVILVTYPSTKDTIWFDMNMENETMGRLLKHTLMTQEPITRPFTEYFEVASCTKCHPAEIDKGF